MVQLKKKPVRFHDDEIRLYEYTKTLNFSAWVKEKLKKHLEQVSEFYKTSTKSKKKLYKNKLVVFTENDLDIYLYAEKLDFSKFVKFHLLHEMNSKFESNQPIEKKCIICGNVNLRTKVTCSEICEKEHKRKLQKNAEETRKIRDKEKRKQYQKDYFQNVRKKKLAGDK